MERLTNELELIINAYGVKAALGAIDNLLEGIDTVEELADAISDELSYAADAAK